MNSHTLSKETKPSLLDYTKKGNVNISNVSEMEDTETGLQDGVDIDDIFLHPHFIKMTIWNAIMNHIPT